jgi:hypothetical protein
MRRSFEAGAAVRMRLKTTQLDAVTQPSVSFTPVRDSLLPKSLAVLARPEEYQDAATDGPTREYFASYGAALRRNPVALYDVATWYELQLELLTRRAHRALIATGLEAEYLNDTMQCVSFQWFTCLGVFVGTENDLPGPIATSFTEWTRSAFPAGTVFPSDEPMMIWCTPDRSALRFCYPRRLSQSVHHHFVRRLYTMCPLDETYDSHLRRHPHLATALPHQRVTYYAAFQTRPVECTAFCSASNGLFIRYQAHSIIGFLLYVQREVFPTPATPASYSLASLRADWDLVVAAPTRRPVISTALEHLQLWVQGGRIDDVIAAFRFPPVVHRSLSNLLCYESQLRYVCEEAAELQDSIEGGERVRRFVFFDAPRRLVVFYDHAEHSLSEALDDGILTDDEYQAAVDRQAQLTAAIGEALTACRLAHWATTFRDPLTNEPVTDQVIRAAPRATPRASSSASANAPGSSIDSNRNLSPTKRP